MDCQCNCCQQACQRRPGWFAPGEVAKAAALKDMTPKKFFDEYICVDYYANGDDSVFVLAPATDRASPGQEYPFNPFGRCVFFKDGLCEIHTAKPNECSFYNHDTTNEICMQNRDKIVEAWKDSQQEIVELLGRKPELPVPDLREMMDMFLEDMYYKLR